MQNTLTVKGAARKKGRRRRFSGEPKGLHNAGNTCFVNAILQATAACPTMLLWLEERREELFSTSNDVIASKDNEEIDLLQDCPKIDRSKSVLQLALLRVLRVANGQSGLKNDDDITEREAVDPEIWAPASLFRALRAHRWVINTDEQDAHEFFQVLLSTVEEELQNKPKDRPASIFDTSEIETLAVEQDTVDDCKIITNANENSIPSAATSEGNSKLDGDIKQDNYFHRGEVAEENRSTRRSSVRQRCKPRSRSSSGVYVRSGEELSMETVIKQTKLSASSTPFTGTLTNKLSFRGSGKCKSPTSSTLFNNITLSLPNTTTESVSNTYSWVSGVNAPPVTLETLLQMFVSVEAVSSGTSINNEKTSGDLSSTTTSSGGITCTRDEHRDLVKQLTFARLPECICFHIQRTAFENGVPRKRNDPVLFPSFLNMDNYVYNRQISKKIMLGRISNANGNQTCETPGSYAQTPMGAETPSYASSNWVLSPTEDDNSQMSSISSTFTDNSKYTYNNNYSLKAVVVHLGAIDSGHYVTYRRESEMLDSPNEEKKKRWFYTSDSVVREVTIDEVLNTNPYMLFYEKG